MKRMAGRRRHSAEDIAAEELQELREQNARLKRLLTEAELAAAARTHPSTPLRGSPSIEPNTTVAVPPAAVTGTLFVGVSTSFSSGRTV